MSQTKAALKQIASSEEYKALAEAIEKGDFATICKSYLSVAGVLEKTKSEIKEKIKNLPRRNKEAEYQRFVNAFDVRARATLPFWYKVDSELKSRKIMEGVVVGIGSKGDPLVRTDTGRLVVLNDAKLTEGVKVRFRVVAESEKVDFGRVFELTAESFYSILTEDAREKIRTSFISVRGRIGASAEGYDSAGLDEALKELENVRQLADKLQPEEKERAIARAKIQRRQLLNQVCMQMMFDTIAQEEEREIRGLYAGDEKKIAEALAAPGLFRQQSYAKAKEEVFAGDEVHGFAEVLSRMEDQVDNMQAAMDLLQFKAKIEDAIPKAKGYLEGMERLYDGLARRLNRLVPELVEANISETKQVMSAITNAFLPEVLASELRRAFHGSEDFSALRGAFVELRTRFGDPNGAVEEAAFKPYLQQRIEQAFGAGRKTAQISASK